MDAVAAPEKVDALHDRTGFDLRHVDRLVFAEYPEVSIAIFEGGLEADVVAAASEARMTPAEVRTDVPFVRRGGLVGERWREFIALRPDVLVVATGQVGEPLAALVARATTGTWADGAGPTIGSAEARALISDWRAAPFAVHYPEPLALPFGHDVSLLLARQKALTVAVVPQGDDDLALAVDLRGAFPHGAERNFRALAATLAASDMGGALGLAEGMPSLRVEAQQGQVVVRMRLEPRSVARGLGLLLGADGPHPLRPPATL
jgi:hypothetical protein